MNRRSAIQWLLGELPELVDEGVLSTDAAQRLERHYQDTSDGPPQAAVVVAIAVIGAALVAGGVILLLAHNWDELSRAARTVVAFVPLLAAQGLVVWTLLRRSGAAAWREGSATALTLALGLTLAVVDQTYHTGNDAMGYLLRWLLLAAPLPWLLRSAVASGLYLVGATSWAITRADLGASPQWVWLLLLALVPAVVHLVRAHRTSLRTVNLLWVVALTVPFVVGSCLVGSMAAVWITVYATLFATLAWLQDAALPDAATWWRRPLANVGALGLGGLFLVFSFADPWHALAHWPRASWTSGAQLAVIVSAGALGALVLVAAARRRSGPVAVVVAAAAPLAAVAAPLVAATGARWVGVAAFNGWLLACGVAALRTGLTQHRLGAVNGGLLALGTLVVARFFDAEIPMLVRSTAFIALGIAFLATNLVLIRRFRATEGSAA